MGFKPRDQAVVHAVSSGDTLDSIAADAEITVDQLTLYNWGTTDAAAVNRALFEIVGCRQQANDGSYVFSDDDATHGAGTILVPQRWNQDGLATALTHTIYIHEPTPAVAVSIDALDKWFIPGDAAQHCEIGFSLEGSTTRANKVTVEVSASNYCSSEFDSDDGVSYSAMGAPVTIHSEEQPADRTRPGSWGTTWDGESTASGGMLEPRGRDHKRYINAAFSPHSVLARYYKNDDNAAPGWSWPTFGPAGRTWAGCPRWWPTRCRCATPSATWPASSSEGRC